MINLDKAFLENNQKYLAVGAVFLVLVAGFAFTSLEGNEGPDNPSEQEDIEKELSDISGDESEVDFVSTRKHYNVSEIEGVDEEAAALYSIGERDLIEFRSVIINETVIPDFKGLGDELYYVLDRNGSSYVYKNGRNVSEGYGSINEIKMTGGELTLTVQDDLLPSYIVRGGEKVGDQYYSAKNPAWVNGELAYKAFDDNQNFIVHGGEELQEFDEVGYPIEADGELAYRVQEGNEEFILHGGEKKASGYDSVEEIYESKNRLTYVVNEEGKLKIMRNGENLIQQNATLLPETVTPINGELAYVVRSGDEQKLIYKDEAVGEEFDIQFSEGLIADLNGKLGFAAKKADNWYIVKET